MLKETKIRDLEFILKVLCVIQVPFGQVLSSRMGNIFLSNYFFIKRTNMSIKELTFSKIKTILLIFLFK